MSLLPRTTLHSDSEHLQVHISAMLQVAVGSSRVPNLQPLDNVAGESTVLRRFLLADEIYLI
jgi:hypothetical protein